MTHSSRKSSTSLKLFLALPSSFQTRRPFYVCTKSRAKALASQSHFRVSSRRPWLRAGARRCGSWGRKPSPGTGSALPATPHHAAWVPRDGTADRPSPLPLIVPAHWEGRRTCVSRTLNLTCYTRRSVAVTQSTGEREHVKKPIFDNVLTLY